MTSHTRLWPSTHGYDLTHLMMSNTWLWPSAHGHDLTYMILTPYMIMTSHIWHWPNMCDDDLTYVIMTSQAWWWSHTHLSKRQSHTPDDDFTHLVTTSINEIPKNWKIWDTPSNLVKKLIIPLRSSTPAFFISSMN